MNLPVSSHDQKFSWIHDLRFSLRSHAHGGHHLGVASYGNLCHKRHQLEYNLQLYESLIQYINEPNNCMDLKKIK